MKLSKKLLAIILPVILFSIPAFAQEGTAGLAWDPVVDAVGYKVYYGDSAANYDQSKDVGDATSTTIVSLPNCQNTYFAIKAYDAEGLESTGYSNEVVGYPQPTIASITPAAVDQGFTGDITVTGNSFDPTAVFAFTNGTIVINSVVSQNCTQFVLNITVPADEVPGDKATEVLNADNVWSGEVAGIFTVNATTPPPAPTNLRRTEKK